MCLFLFHISEHGQIKRRHLFLCEYAFGGLGLGMERSRELLTWKTFAAELHGHGSAFWLPCPCGPSVTAAVGPGRLFPLGLVLSLPPDSRSLPNAEEDVQEQTGRGRDCPEGADPMAVCIGV